jgi:hypothetical protein
MGWTAIKCILKFKANYLYSHYVDKKGLEVKGLLARQCEVTVTIRIFFAIKY